MTREELELSANVTIIVSDAAGREVSRERRHNLVVTAGRNQVAAYLAADDPAPPSHIAVGTSATAVSASQTALVAEVFRSTLTKTVQTSGTVTFSHYVSTDEANGNTIREAALLSASSGGTMTARVTHDAVVKTASVAITYVWEVGLAAAEG